MNLAMTEEEINKARAEIIMATWDYVPADFRRVCAMAEYDRATARLRYANEPGVIQEFLMALDMADEFVAVARMGYGRANAELLAVMETRVRWAAIRKQLAKRQSTFTPAPAA